MHRQEVEGEADDYSRDGLNAVTPIIPHTGCLSTASRRADSPKIRSAKEL